MDGEMMREDNQMDRDLTDLTPDEIMERWEALRQRVVNCWEAMAEVLPPAFKQVVHVVRAFMVQLQRAQLGTSLAHHWWIPERFAYWLSDKWPERWLPELRFTE